MNFLISGCAGFIGYHLANKLIDIGYNVTGIDSLNDYYDVNLKKSYRKLAIKHHPDKVAHLGEDHVQAAEDKFQKIQEAYDEIKEKRGLN